MKIFVLVLFILMYILMIIRQKERPVFALVTGAVFIVVGVVPFRNLLSVINWNVLLMITGTMIIVFYFIESQMPNLLADLLLEKSPNVMWVTILMSLFAGIISAFIDNVATVLMVAPVGLAICKKLKIKPVGMILSVAVSSNLQGAATLVGDTTSIMLGDYAKMNFLDFFWMKGRAGIFFAVELGALATIPVMAILFRKYKEKVEAKERTKVRDYFPTIILLMMVLALIIASFLPNMPDMINGIICMALACVIIITNLVRRKKIGELKKILKAVDYETIALLLGLFVVIGGLVNVGVIDDIAKFIIKHGGNNVFLLYTIVVWGSVLISAFVDNIPYVATMLPVLTAVTNTLGIEPYLLYFGLLSGATLGGNITPIGASANITAVGLLRKNGYEVSFKDFMKIGVPYTLTAVCVGYLYFWLLWK